MSFIDDLEKVCERATDGEWVEKDHAIMVSTGKFALDQTAVNNIPENRKFIALANPQAVKFLIKTIGAMVLFMDVDDAIRFKKVLDKGPKCKNE